MKVKEIDQVASVHESVGGDSLKSVAASVQLAFRAPHCTWANCGVTVTPKHGEGFKVTGMVIRAETLWTARSAGTSDAYQEPQPKYHRFSARQPSLVESETRVQNQESRSGSYLPFRKHL